MSNSSSESKDSFIIAIGASAGGVQALETFFSNLPDHPSAAFVVIQHLSPNYKSMMTGLVDEILSPQDLARTVFELIRFSRKKPSISPQDITLIDTDQLQQILNTIAKNEDINFSHYKISTLARRIHRRCALTNSSNLKNYSSLLENSEEEQKLLRQDLLNCRHRNCNRT
ncbi:MAG: chemotaxis protein CheB [Rivularia sp. (in: cyanobacteria)]